ncbi:DedA family protein [Sphingomonas sp. CGMCC 1.13654]|uniref:DedA family protein n=1 Tax=Sphingomonas chungangi TaxID=2683589 RepID=A0A838L9G2_9SPHN|nr:DedA family protein [Sphingomonas chungangi]MBA2935540.1 DedA family protein [Sphingomonas chungangi]MVW54233.1 DedA family protein [Sphingomonas chungangi]
MPLQALIARFGLGAVFLGAGLEGETAVIAGGILAHQHILSLPGVAIAGALGSFSADRAFFLFGRHFRDHPRVEKMLDKPAAERALDTLEKHPIAFVLGFRFLYGLRTISPVAVGTSDVPQARFSALNAVAAILWSLLFTAVGYGLGGPLGRYFHRPKSIVPFLVAGLLILGIGLFVLRKFWGVIRAKRRRQAGIEKGVPPKTVK